MNISNLKQENGTKKSNMLIDANSRDN